MTLTLASVPRPTLIQFSGRSPLSTLICVASFTMQVTALQVTASLQDYRLHDASYSVAAALQTTRYKLQRGCSTTYYTMQVITSLQHYRLHDAS